MDELPLSERVPAKVLAAQARARGGEPFVYCGGAWHSYEHVNSRANRVAHGLVERGVAKGSRVAILMANRIEFLELWFGLSKIGAVQVPLSDEYRAAQIHTCLQRSRIELIVAEAALLPELTAACGLLAKPIELLLLDASPEQARHASAYEEMLRSACDAEPAALSEVSGADPAAIMSTSGTTGASKGVLLSHAQQYILGRNIAADLSMSADDVFYNCFPLFHNTAQAMITLPVLLSGARMVLYPRFSASRFWPDVREHGCTLFYYIGEILRILLATSRREHAAGARLRAGWGIGATSSDAEEFQRRFGVDLRTGYGSTEANVPCFLPRTGGKPGSAGRVLPGFELRVAGEGGEPLPAGVTGDILVRSHEPCALMLGYDDDAQATVAAWRDLWLHTGDLGYLDADGDLFFVARQKDAIRVRGENVSALEVEQAIAALDGVLEVAAIAVPCELGGDDVKVVVVERTPGALRPQAVTEWARACLPRYAVPRYVEFVAALPKTPTNKVQKHLLRAAPFGANTWDGAPGPGRCTRASHPPGTQETKCSI